jgi:glycosyltransferase involved in cell wall biosynthesis
VDIIRKYEKRLAFWQSCPDQGFGDALRQGFQRSQGEILTYLNSDDLLAPDAVEQAVQMFDRRPGIDMVYGNRVGIDGEGRFLYYKPSLPILGHTPYIAMTLSQESCFWKREAYQRVGGINPGLRFAVDYDLFSRIARTGRLAHAGPVWGFFRKHKESKTMLLHESLGVEEGAQVQELVWNGRVNPLAWALVWWLVRAYAVLAVPFVSKPHWPRCLPLLRHRNLFRRYFDSLHESSPAKQRLRKLARRFRGS